MAPIASCSLGTPKKIYRSNLLDISFLIFIRVDSESRLENLYAVTRNLSKNFRTNIILKEVDDTPKVDTAKLPSDVQYYFCVDKNLRLHHTKHINQMICKAITPYISIYDADTILARNQILEAAKILRTGKISAVSPYNGNFLNVDPLMKCIFKNIQDAELFEENQNKLISASKRSYGGAIFLNKDHYIDAGLENENLIFWGPNDIERIKRLTVLGYKVKRINGNLYHLCHSRGLNSGYQSLEEQENLMQEFLKICNMDRERLRQYVSTWPWK